MPQVVTVDVFSQELSVIGYAALPVFALMADGTQPMKASERAYALNRGGFQLPLWLQPPPLHGRLSAKAMHHLPRLPCASVLLRVLTVSEADGARCAAW